MIFERRAGSVAKKKLIKNLSCHYKRLLPKKSVCINYLKEMGRIEVIVIII